MPEQGQIVPEEEPIGIVITRGRHDDVAPRFSAYIWGTTDDSEDESPVTEVSVAAA